MVWGGPPQPAQQLVLPAGQNYGHVRPKSPTKRLGCRRKVPAENLTTVFILERKNKIV
jgi:hypothetical protein